MLLTVRFKEWKIPDIEDGKPTKYNWIVQNKNKLSLGYMTDIGAFTYINAKNGVTIEDYVQLGSHCSVYSHSTIDNKQGEIGPAKELPDRNTFCHYARCNSR